MHSIYNSLVRRMCLSIVYIALLSITTVAHAAPQFSATVDNAIITATLTGVPDSSALTLFSQDTPYASNTTPSSSNAFFTSLFNLVTKQVSPDGTTITWKTPEVTRGHVYYVRAEEQGVQNGFISTPVKIVVPLNLTWPLTATEPKGTSLVLQGKILDANPQNFEISLSYSRRINTTTKELLDPVKKSFSQKSSAQTADYGVGTDGTYVFPLTDLSPSTLYFIEQVITIKGTTTVVNTNTGTFNSSKGIMLEGTEAYNNDFNTRSYTFLAPIKSLGLETILDYDLCKEYATQGKEGYTDAKCDNQIGNFINLILKVLIAASAVLLVIQIIIKGYQYMTTDIPYVSVKAKTRIGECALGLLLALSSYVILNTINPKLVENRFGVEGLDIGVEDVYNRADNASFISRLDAVSINGVTANISDETFIIYLSHQQGAAGANAILQAARNGTAPSQTITRNMSGNFNRGDAQKTINTTVLTPTNFLNYWAIRVAAFKKNPSANIPADITAALSRVSQETGISLTTLQVICRIESGCNGSSAINAINPLGYAGLFQLSNSIHMKQKNPGIWETFKKPDGVLLDAYHNTYAAAQYAKLNLKTLNKYISATPQTPASNTSTTKSVLAIGDSITAPVGGFTYMDRFAKQNTDWVVNNKAVSGKTTSWMLSTIQAAEAEGKKYAVVTIMGSTNDVVAGTLTNTIKNNLDAMIKIAKRIGTKVVVISSPIQQKQYTNLATQNQSLSDINSYLALYPGISFVDFYTTTKNKPSLISNDGIHPTNEGQATLFNLVSQKIK